MMQSPSTGNIMPSHLSERLRRIAAHLQHSEQRRMDATRNADDIPVAWPGVLWIQAQHAKGRLPELAKVHLHACTQFSSLHISAP